MRGARVILACRNQQLGEAVARTICKKTRNGDVLALYLDLASLQCIRDFVKQFKEKENKLNILINNAGKSFTEYKIAIDSFDLFDLQNINTCTTV